MKVKKKLDCVCGRMGVHPGIEPGYFDWESNTFPIC